jgi:predicted metalloprotease with PDZ domain
MIARISAAVIICALGGASVFADRATEPVHYQLTPVMTHGALTAVAIELRFKGEADGETMLLLPNEWGGESQLWHAVTDLKISGDGVQVQPVTNPAERVMKHAPNGAILVSYRIIQDVPGEDTAGIRNNPYRPIVQRNYFHLLGNAIFARPVGDDYATASFVVQRLPPGWRFASDLEHKALLTFDDLIQSVLVGGDFRIVSRPGPGGFLRVALRGKWQFSDDQLADKTARIVTSHNAFWHDPPEPYLVTLLQLKNPGGGRSLGGTGRGDAFAFFATDNNDDARINRVLAHEHTHTWIPLRIGAMPATGEALDYWLSEGFTDFYAFRLLARDGMWTVEEFTDTLNETLAAYWSSPVRNAPNTRIGADFWTTRTVEELPYQRGYLMALIWDKRLHDASDGARDLDEVMLDAKARFAPVASQKDAPHAVDIFATAMRAAKLDPAADIARYIEHGESILLPADTFGPCGNLATLELPEFARGFDSDKTAAAGNVVTGTDPEGPAHAAGMRDGMRLLKRESGRPGDSRIDLAYLVDDHGTVRTIRYKPEGKKRATLQELQLTPGLDGAARAACVARIGGT